MPTLEANAHDAAALAAAQESFLAALPRLQTHINLHLRHRDPGRQDDLRANAIGLAWKHWLAAIRGGKNPGDFVSAIADFCVRQVRAGRRPQSQERPRDVLSPRAQRIHNFVASGLPQHETGVDDNEVIDALESDDTPPPDAAAFRVDYPAWLKTLSARDRRLAQAMALGEHTKPLAEKFHLSQARVSQMRREFAESWRDFVGDRDEEVVER
jgi:hypothetical protein